MNEEVQASRLLPMLIEAAARVLRLPRMQVVEHISMRVIR